MLRTIDKFQLGEEVYYKGNLCRISKIYENGGVYLDFLNKDTHVHSGYTSYIRSYEYNNKSYVCPLINKKLTKLLKSL